MIFHKRFLIFLIGLFSLNFFVQAVACIPGNILSVRAAPNTVTAGDLINLIKGMRTANGLGALAVDSSLMACAQNTADTMAQFGMFGHIGDVSGRVSTFGYNNGNKAFATENFMIGPTTLANIQSNWSDADHMIPVTSASYCHIGAGVSAEVNGKVYYVIQAAYPGNVAGCGFSSAGSKTTSTGSSSGSIPNQNVIDASQIIKSIKIATADANGDIYHIVENGQTLWGIASAYQVSEDEIAAWNNLSDKASLRLGQKLLIPKGDSFQKTPTIAATILPTMDGNHEFRHVIVEGDTLSSIAKLWKTTINEIIQKNGLKEDSTLQLGWKLLIPVTPTVTPTVTSTYPATQTLLPTETPQPSLTPAFQPTIPEIEKNHRPQASLRTYLILSAFSLFFLGVIFVFIRLMTQKKS